MADVPINPEYDAEIYLRLKGGHMDAGMPVENPTLAREMLSLGFFSLENGSAAAKIEAALPLPDGCKVKIQEGKIVVVAPMNQGVLARRLLSYAIVRVLELDRQSNELAQKLFRGGQLLNGRK